MKIEGVIFDWGGVLHDNPGKIRDRYISKRLDVKTEDYIKIQNKYWPKLVTAKISEKQYWKKVGSSLKVNIPKDLTWGKATEIHFKPKKEMYKLVLKLKKNGYKIAMLTDTEIGNIKRYSKKFKRMFHVVTASCYVKLIKPDKRIYLLTLEKLKIAANNSIFIDDRKVCIDGAKKVGMKIIQFKSVSQVKKELKNIGVKI